MFWIDAKYIGSLSPYLPDFIIKRSSPYLANSRCPICGDSKKDRTKKRAFYFEHKGSILFKCHNCGASFPLGLLLKKLSPELHREYQLETMKESGGTFVRKTQPISDKPKVISTKGDNEPLKRLRKISQLAWDHPAKKYLEGRHIPPEAHWRLYYAPKFFAWTNSIIPDKFKGGQDEPRLVLPMFDAQGNMFGYQGRSFDPNAKTRYFSIMIKEHSKVFGLETIDRAKRVYITEGPLDSLFLPNAIAMAGADIDFNLLDPEKDVFIFDNEPRNKEIVARMEKVIDRGFGVLIWPDNVRKEGTSKDINDLIMSGYDRKRLESMIALNTYKGFNAKAKMMTWSRV